MSAAVSPVIRNLLLSQQTQIETIQRQLDNTDAVKGAEAHLKEVIATCRRMLFGSKSEKTRYLSNMDQMSLFHGAEAAQNTSGKKDSVVVKEHAREVKPKGRQSDFIKRMIESGKFPVEAVVYDVPEEKRFDAQGNPLERMGVEHVRYELTATPKQYSIKDIQVVSYGSKRSKASEGKRSEVVEGEVPPVILPHCPVGASVLADVIINKCDYGLPHR